MIGPPVPLAKTTLGTHLCAMSPDCHVPAALTATNDLAQFVYDATQRAGRRGTEGVASTAIHLGVIDRLQ